MKQLTVIATALLLTTVAISFALWADVLKIQLVAYTGNVDVQFGSYSVKEYVGFPASGGGWSFVPEGSDPEAKDVGQCTVALQDIENEEDTSLGTKAGNNDLDLVITITNGYPGYKCEVKFDVVNKGTIPVKLYFFDQGGNRLTPLPATFTISNAVTCTLSGEDGAQVHPDKSETYTLSCVVQQSASEDSQYSTQIYIQARQWNEPLS
jgi:hypothetical protein